MTHQRILILILGLFVTVAAISLFAPQDVDAQNATPTSSISSSDRINTAVAQTLTQRANLLASITPTRTATLMPTPTTSELSEEDIQTAAAATIAALISATPSPTATSRFWQTETAVAHTISSFDDLFGEDQWFCIPNARNSIGVKALPSNYLIPSDMIQVDARDRQYFPGDRVANPLPATIYFSFVINFENCPEWQREHLLQWLESEASPIELTREWLDSQFGRGNWYCTVGLLNNIMVTRLDTDFIVQYPFSSADDTESYYGVGETIHAGRSIGVWTFDIPRSECP